MQREMETSEESGENGNNNQDAGAAGAAGEGAEGGEGGEVGGDDDASARTLSTPFHQQLIPHHLLRYLSTFFETRSENQNQANLASINAPSHPLMEALWIIVPGEFDVFAHPVMDSRVYGGHGKGP
jgi:hypothetical protein